jgi:hypothetical protein
MTRKGIIRASIVLLIAAPVRLDALTYLYTFDRHFDWDDVAGPAGMGGHALWEVVPEGGNPGGALHISTDFDHKDFRAIQLNVEPGTEVRIQFDIRIPLQDPSPSTFIRARYFGGYVSALSFVSADSLDSPYPPPFFEHGSGTDDTWRHVDHTTPPVENSVFTMIFHIEGFLPTHDGRNECFIDNLQFDFTPSSEFRDSTLEWDGKPGTKFIDWRLNANGAHIAWCDFMEERDHWFDGFCKLVPAKIDYDSMYDTTQFPLENHVKTDYEHNATDLGMSGVLRVNVSHDEAHGKIYGIRQTVSYDAILPGGAPGECLARAEAGIYDGLDQTIARFWLGVDPYGGRDFKEGRYPECTGCCDGAPILWDCSFSGGHFDNLHQNPSFIRPSLRWERPPDAEAFTVLLKCMDWRGNTNGGSIGADFIVNAVTVTGIPKAVRFNRGNANGDGVLDLADPISLLEHLFCGGPAPGCEDAADADDDGVLGMTDAIRILEHLFLAGEPPEKPFGACGTDPTADAIACRAFAACP